MMPLLEIKNVTKDFGGLKALHEVSMQVNAGEIVSLIGPNGAGKTTLFNCITGTMPPSSGHVTFEDKPLDNLPSYEVAAKGVTRTFQHIRLFNQMTVLDNVMVGNDHRGRTGIFSALIRPPWVAREERKTRQKSLDILSLF